MGGKEHGHSPPTPVVTGARKTDLQRQRAPDLRCAWPLFLT